MTTGQGGGGESPRAESGEHATREQGPAPTASIGVDTPVAEHSVECAPAEATETLAEKLAYGSKRPHPCESPGATSSDISNGEKERQAATRCALAVDKRS